MTNPESDPASLGVRLFEKRRLLYWTAFAALVASIVLAMIRYPLTWGLMDDHINIGWVRGPWKTLSLWEVLRAHSVIYWFRPVYAAFVYVAYGLFQDHPKVFYVVNLFFVMGCCLPCAWLLRRHLATDHRTDGVFLYAFALFAWTSMSTLILYLSLQEKFIILLGGTALLCFDLALWKPEKPRLPSWALITIGMIGLSLALLTKPTALTYVPWLFLALLSAPGLSMTRRGAYLAGLLVPVAIMIPLYFHSSDSYSQRYWDNWGTKLLMLQSRVYGFLLLGIGTAGLVLYRQRKEGPAFPRLSPSLVWPLSLLVYLGLQIPWGLFSYNWTPAMVFASGCLALWLDFLATTFPQRRRAICLGTTALLAVFAGIITARVTIPRLAEQSELSPLVQWLRGHLPDPSVDVYALPPLIEGSIALMTYTDGVQTIRYIHHEEAVPRERPRAWLLASPGVPLGPLHAAEFRHPVFQTAHWTIWERGP